MKHQLYYRQVWPIQFYQVLGFKSGYQLIDQPFTIHAIMPKILKILPVDVYI